MRWIYCRHCRSEYLSDQPELWICPACMKQITINYLRSKIMPYLKPNFFIKSIIVAILLLIACIFVNAHADGPVYIEGKAGCYQYALLDYNGTLTGNNRPLIIDTARNLAIEKDKVFRSATDEKILTPLGKSIYGRLNKLPDVQSVTISYRQIAVKIFPFPNQWEADKAHPDRKAILNDVLNVIDSVLCGK
jgi:hypothetical protein